MASPLVARLRNAALHLLILFVIGALAQTQTTDVAPTTLPPYCTTAPTTSVFDPHYTFATTTLTKPLPCPGVYAVQEGYCCSGGVQCFASSGSPNCTCPDGEVVWSLPLAPCVSLNPFWSGCPGNMQQGMCCSGGGIYGGGDSNNTVGCWKGATQVFTITTMGNGSVSTSSFPPGIGYTDTRCYTCPLYTRSRSSTAGVPAAVTGALARGVVEKVVVVGLVLLAGL